MLETLVLRSSCILVLVLGKRVRDAEAAASEIGARDASVEHAGAGVVVYIVEGERAPQGRG